MRKFNISKILYRLDTIYVWMMVSKDMKQKNTVEIDFRNSHNFKIPKFKP